MVHRHEHGFTTIQYVVATGFSLLLFVLIGNLLVDLYARGAMRDALDEGVRAAVPVGADAATCETTVRDVVRSVAGGSVLRVEALACTRDGDRIVADADIALKSWLPMVVPEWRMHLRAEATGES